MGTDVSAFFSDWQHKSDDMRPSTYTAVRIAVYQCGKCRIAIDPGHWPSYCAQGHRNERPE